MHARICKTFLDAVQQTSLPTLYGGIVGLGALGQTVIRSVLLPQMSDIEKRLLLTGNMPPKISFVFRNGD